MTITQATDFQGEAHELFNQVKAILENKEAAAEDLAKVPQLNSDAKALQMRSEQLSEVLAGMDKAIEHVSESTPNYRNQYVPYSGYGMKAGRRKSVWDEPDDPDDNAWGRFLEACWIASHNDPAIRKMDPRLTRFQDKDEDADASRSTKGKKAGSTGTVGASLGYLIPPEFYTQIMSLAPENAIVRPRATIIRMRRRLVGVPVLDQTVTTAGLPHWFGGFIFYWEDEASEKTLSEVKFRSLD